MTSFDIRRHFRGGMALALSTGLLVACAGSQPRPPELVRLENELARLQSDPVVSAKAPEELHQATNAVYNLSEHGDDMKAAVFDHHIYMADRLLQIAEAEGRSRFARERIDTLSAERERLVAEARAMEAERARREANMARQDANAALAQADAERREAAMARERAEAERRDAMLARQQAEAIEPVWDALVADSSVPSVGPLDAPVTVIEFFDYHCGYCKRAFDGVKELAENSDGKIRTMFVEFPILREESADAARAALAAAKQGKYMEIHAAFMENRGILDEAQINTLAKDAGVDVDQMRKDMQSPEINGMLQQYAAMARSIGVNGTPAFLINGQMVSGADMERVNALVKAGLEQAS